MEMTKGQCKSLVIKLTINITNNEMWLQGWVKNDLVDAYWLKENFSYFGMLDTALLYLQISTIFVHYVSELYGIKTH